MLNNHLVATSLSFAIICGASTQMAAAKLYQADIPKLDERRAASLDEIYNRLASRRNLQIARVHAYAAAGRFPLNTDFPDQLVPYFVDHVGTACAVGHLMRLDGCDEIVNGIARSCNHVRIEHVDRGPLIDWIRSSGLTKDECAFIQPSYATIEDYRQGPPWQNEVKRLREHFSEVEQTLLQQSQKSLGEALLTKVEAELQRDSGAAFTTSALIEALKSDEPNVRTAAAYAMARINPKQANRAVRIAALEPNLADRDSVVRFWTAVALEKIGSASSRGAVELHRLTLPVFLSTLEGNRDDIRLPALIQLASISPECIGTNRQLRVLPEIRHALVTACRDNSDKLRECAQKVLSTFRWQRTAYESQRMRRHYLADSYELESLAAEALALGREFADQPSSVKDLLQRRSLYDVKESITYLLPVGTETTMPIAITEAQAGQIVDDYNRTTQADWLKQGNPPFWKIESVEPDKNGLYFVVTVLLTDSRERPKLVYIIPRPSMITKASAAPSYWFETIHQSAQYVWPAAPPSAIRPRPDIHIVLGDLARDDLKGFAAACDIFAYFMTHHALVVIDRDVQESTKTLTWSGRFASLRQYQMRFFELGGGGWDFYRLTIACDRATGSLTLSAEPITYPVAPLANEILTPAWVTEELKLMGWKPLKSIAFFGEKLMPPEYCDTVEQFDPANAEQARNVLYRRWYMEKSLPHPYLVLGLLFEQKGQREESLKWIKQAAADGRNEPGTLADISRWELSIGMHASALEHAKAALELWPDHPVAKDVLEKLSERGTKSN